jgi:trehalose 2-sulfotransferase
MVSPKICYIIASAPRSGSHLLSSLMSATGLAGKPEEHFNPWHMGLAGEFPMDLIFQPEHVQQLIESTTTPNGVFGTKAQFTQVSNFVGMQRLESLFPTPLQYIYIQRKDDLRQAISLARAVQTNRYMWDQQEERTPTFNRQLIFQCMREIKIQEKGWEMHFFQNHIEPFRVIYEEFIQDTAAVIRSVLNYLGIEIPEGLIVPKPPIEKLADEVTEEWVREYQSIKD